MRFKAGIMVFRDSNLNIAIGGFEALVSVKVAAVVMVVCVTAQHRQMLDQVLSAFGVTPDYDLNIMKDRQTLFDITNHILDSVKEILEKEKPDVVLVHGDTSTTFVTALACFYLRIPVGHVDAGLRTYDIYNPYPEEFNREAVSIISQYNFAPTPLAADNLRREGRKESSIYLALMNLGWGNDEFYFHRDIIFISIFRTSSSAQPLNSNREAYSIEFR